MYTVKELEDRELIIFSAIMGSHAYGTSTSASDTDIRGVFIQPIEDVMKYGFVDQVSDDGNDIVYYEIGRFIDLIQKNNPNIIEILFAPDDVVQIRQPIFDELFKYRHKFLTKICKDTFAGYAITQIRKAKGYNKKINWEEAQMTRRGVLDFCYIIEEGKSIKLIDWIQDNYEEKTYKDFALAKIDHAHDIYAMYQMYEGDPSGIVSDTCKANDVQLFSIPKNRTVKAHMTFNKDAYSIHCKRYNEYQDWLKKRNEDRFKMNKEHGKNYDSKNMMHTFRLLNVAIEIATQGTINVKRSEKEIEKLMKIRKGEYEYDDLLSDAEKLIKNLDEVYGKTSLPDKVDKDFTLNILQDIRTTYYHL